MRKISLTIVGLSLLLPCASSKAVVFNEVGGVVVVEAVNFTSRSNAIGGDPHHFSINPDEERFLVITTNSSTEVVTANSRSGRYIQNLPNNGGSFNSIGIYTNGPSIDYKVNITTTGIYQLYLRWVGSSGTEDSSFATILELQTTAVPPGPGPNWYRYISVPPAPDFATVQNDPNNAASGLGWNGYGAPDNTGGGGGEGPAVWTISTPGVYTIRWFQREDGPALDALILQLSSLTAPSNPGPAESPCSSCFLINTQPKDVSASPTATATFSIVVNSSSTPTYQWQSQAPGEGSFVDVGGATSSSYTTPATILDDNGTKYRVIVTASGFGTNTSSAATLIVDNTPPTATATGSALFDRVVVTFSEPVTTATGTNLANYSLNGGLTVSSVSLSADGRTATLKHNNALQVSGTVYTLTLQNIADLRTPANVMPSTDVKFTAHVLLPGALGYENWFPCAGEFYTDIINNAHFQNDPADLTATATAFDTRTAYPDDTHENYIDRMRGYLTPTVSGNYQFFIRSDDDSQLSVSTDSSFSNLVVLCQGQYQLPGYVERELRPDIASDFVALEAGTNYAVQSLHKEGIGADHFSCAWRIQGDPTSAGNLIPIRGRFLSWYADPANFKITSITYSNGNVTIVWPAGTLQSADQVTGPYSDVLPVATTTSPYTAAVTAGPKFYRLRN